MTIRLAWCGTSVASISQIPTALWAARPRRIDASAHLARQHRGAGRSRAPCARSVAEVVAELGRDWHTVNDTVLRNGEALVDVPGRFEHVRALGLDEVLVVRRGANHRGEFATSIADVEAGPYRADFGAMVPGMTQVADPFHVVRHANAKLDECCRRVQNETLGHRSRKGDPLSIGSGPAHHGRRTPRRLRREDLRPRASRKISTHRAALRRQAQGAPTRHHHIPLKI